MTSISAPKPASQFYRDLLGMHGAEESENYGTEQEHLNNLFGAHLRITALRGAIGPGIELLEYLAPSRRTAFPIGRTGQRCRSPADGSVDPGRRCRRSSTA